MFWTLKLSFNVDILAFFWLGNCFGHCFLNFGKNFPQSSVTLLKCHTRAEIFCFVKHPRLLFLLLISEFVKLGVHQMYIFPDTKSIFPAAFAAQGYWSYGLAKAAGKMDLVSGKNTFGELPIWHTPILTRRKECKCRVCRMMTTPKYLSFWVTDPTVWLDGARPQPKVQVLWWSHPSTNSATTFFSFLVLLGCGLAPSSQTVGSVTQKYKYFGEFIIRQTRHLHSFIGWKSFMALVGERKWKK